MDGSSLLTRGTRCVLYLTVHRNGFIPAYAGNSETEVRHGSGCTVHPRLRGELDLRFLVIMIVYGSSPLTRGTLSKFWQRRPERRFIPAYAGNSQRENSFTLQSTVHPRLRGELIEDEIDINNLDGSSPLTRGTHLKWLQHYTNRLTAKLLKNISKQE